MPPKKAKKSKGKESASAFAFDFSHDIGKTVQVPGSFWQNTTGDERTQKCSRVLSWSMIKNTTSKAQQKRCVSLPIKLQSPDANINR